ncbi:aminotransferase class III-fold pyridoxal phosphate-dependent enzyme [Umezawaea sp. Da 62-37]|uniref:aminotransferase family protein n=1 Tax=Umezawaea sp. Da 62-37 TaxID=3075927 RepID=UPI0028F6EAAD|nr:aminotransferase class III-fold pyridoxal phosphate-dependent enzyme [Umezawaea sp. Da 62-37]WNV85137.1 aminotransferase class III-fold pyridoxal phosphate-dependent enzyme [Umezawaea sp. Da 62-37]
MTEHHALWFNALTTKTSPEDVRDRALVSGEGCHVTDAAGRRYLDARSALWNAGLGYSNTAVADAVRAQLDQLPVAQLIRHDQPPQVSLRYAERLVAVLPEHLRHVRLCSTGSQAVEGAVFLSRFVRILQGDPDRSQVIAQHDGYHGIGGLASAVTGEPELHELHGPLVPGVHHVRPWDMEELRTALDRIGPGRVTAIILEPILGTGALEAPPGYLEEVQRLCREHGVHFVVDEVSTGFGRTGTLTVTEELGLEPDMLLLSKAISAGYTPLAAIATTAEILAGALARPDVVFPHGSTADGNPVSAAAGLAVLDELADGVVLENVRARGAQLTAGLAALPSVLRVRGRGLMLGVDLELPAEAVAELRLRCREAGLLVSTAGSTVIVTPPLVITAADCDELVGLLAVCLAPVTA